MARRRLSFAVFLIICAALAFVTNPATAATEKVLHSFAPYLHGYDPSAIVGDAAGNFYVTARGGSFGRGVVLKFTLNAQGGATESILYAFRSGNDGDGPVGLFLDPSGNLYGLTAGGGTQNAGIFFELMPTAHGSWKESILYNFSSVTNTVLAGGLVKDSSGNFYGTSYANGPAYGSAFQLVPGGSGWTLNVLHTFTGGSDGGYPLGKLALDQAGNVYGTAELGGINNEGLAFELSPSSGGKWTETVLHDFTAGTDGWGPGGAVIFDEAGNLYGTTVYGGAAKCNAQGGCGTVFELSPAGGAWTEKIVYTFGNASGDDVDPQDLYFDAAGDLYGTTFEGGGEGCCGTAFKLTLTAGQWSETTIYTFTGAKGYYPSNDIVFGSAGQIYGVTLLGGTNQLTGTFYELTPASGPWTYATLYAFPISDGEYVYSGVTFDAAGNLYGTANTGGANGFGMAYKLAPGANGSWAETNIYNFTSGLTSNGSRPSSLIFDSAGNLYGASGYSDEHEYGFVYELSPTSHGAWTETTIDQMGGKINNPSANPIFDNAGNLYGTTNTGGTKGFGAVYELTPQGNGKWTQTILYNFLGDPNDGANPAAALVMDSAGNLYGTTTKGGAGNCSGSGDRGCGVVFELQPVAGGTWTEKVLYSFQGRPNDGSVPAGNLILDKNGNLFGTTSAGAIKNKSCTFNNGGQGCGTVYELSPGSGGWTETVIYEFTGVNGGGGNPQAGLVFDGAGNLYGTTAIGGTFNFGTVYKLTPVAGGGFTETVLYSFDQTDGQWPYNALILDAAGNLYGTTYEGGDAGFGTVFEITP
jgi:uncharacterized repeat protein (TIGR03803 family)